MVDIEKALQDIANVIGILAGAIAIARLLSVVRAFVAQDLLSILSTIILSIALLLLTKKDLDDEN